MRPSRFTSLTWPILVSVWVLCMGPGPGMGRAVAAESGKVEGSGLQQLAAFSAEVQRLAGEIAQKAGVQKQEEALAAREAEQIERLKEEPEGVARDLQLQEKLARAQSRAVELSQRSALLQKLMGQQRLARQRLIQACDRVLADASGPQLMAAQRLEVLRLRAAQVEALMPAETFSLGPAVRATEEAQPDDPAVLRERADLLRDSEDKVRRELLRLSQRAEEVLRRRHLRERAAQVDEDLFAEQVSSRRSTAGGRTDAAGAARDTPAAQTPGPVPPAGPFTPTPSATPASPSRSGLDPATLDLLRKSDASTDPEVKLQAMRRAQTELQKLADELRRRAISLDRRADELRRRK